MIAQFYLREYLGDETEIPIFEMHNIEKPPFEVGQEMELSVEDIHLTNLSKYKEKVQKNIIERNKKEVELFNFKRIRIVDMQIYTKIYPLKEALITVEYHCIIIQDIRD